MKIERIRARLLEESRELRHRQESLKALQSATEEIMNQIDSAFERLNTGTYGVCQRCSSLITTARLETVPHAVYCESCQGVIDTDDSYQL